MAKMILTEEQKESIDILFTTMEAMAEAGLPGALFAQISDDGESAKVVFVTNEYAARIAEIMKEARENGGVIA